MADAAAPQPKTMAERHRDEIRDIIDRHEATLQPHKELAFWREDSGKPKPPGHSVTTSGQAHAEIKRVRAIISQGIAAACERHRAEANAPAPKAAAPTDAH